MAFLLGIDTGGTYTDAVLLDDENDKIIAQAKALTTRPDLSHGVASAIEAVMADSSATPEAVAMVSLSTTLATNALVEGQGERVALVLIGFDRDELSRADLADAIGDDPVFFVPGGHNHAGTEKEPFDDVALRDCLTGLTGVRAVAVASLFGTRNPDHENRARDIVRSVLDVPVTCSHELSQALGGPKRALTAVLNARLIGLIDRLIVATQAHLAKLGVDARLMVVRGDGALISAEMARERPIETILSGPAASIAGAQWLTGMENALVSDIGGTTTDICVLENGQPKIDPKGAKVGKYRTMVEAVAMRTFGLGGDSQVTVLDGLEAGLRLGPRRVMPVCLLALSHPDLVHGVLDRAKSLATPAEETTRFVVPQWDVLPDGLDPREAAVVDRLADGPRGWADVVRNRVEIPAVYRLVQRGTIMLCDITPTDASHALGRLDDWDGSAATKAFALFAKRRTGSGDRIAPDVQTAATRVLDQLTNQTVSAVLETAFAEERWADPAGLAEHALTLAGLDGHSRLLRIDAGLALPLIGLGASAQSYYGAVGDRLRCKSILPPEGGVANAIGAVVGQISVHAEANITSAGEGAFRAHLPSGPVQFNDKEAAIAAVRTNLTETVSAKANAMGVEDMSIEENLDLRETQIEAQVMFVEAKIRVTAKGRPRIAS